MEWLLAALGIVAAEEVEAILEGGLTRGDAAEYLWERYGFAAWEAAGAEDGLMAA